MTPAYLLTDADRARLAIEYRRTAAELWHLFSLTSNPRTADKLATDAQEADSMADTLTAPSPY